MIFVGRLAENKGINLFLETVKKINCRAIIVGDGPMKNEVELSARSGGEITIHGWAKDSAEIAQLINKSKILIMPSYNEGGPRVVVEAMACGVPVLASPVGIVPDLLKHGFVGEMIDWDADDIAKKAVALLSDLVRYDRLSNGAVEIAKSFEKKTAIRNYAEKLTSIIR